MEPNFSPGYNYQYEPIKLKEIYLKQKSVSFLHKKVVNLYISYRLDKWSKDLLTGFTLGNYLLRAVNLTKNTDPDKYKHSGYSTGFDSRSHFSWRSGSMKKIVEVKIFYFLAKNLRRRLRRCYNNRKS